MLNADGSVRDLVSTTQVCHILNRDKRTIRRWIAEGRLRPVYKLAGKTGAYVFRAEDIDALAEQLSEKVPA